MSTAKATEYRRAGWFTFLLLLVNAVNDGFSGRPNGLLHQLLVLPVTAFFLLACWELFFADRGELGRILWSPTRALRLVLMFEVLAGLVVRYEGAHFAFLGYRLYPRVTFIVFTLLVLAMGILALRSTAAGVWIWLASVAGYVAGEALAIASFPLNYMRSDMLPVILWADTNLVHHISPYTTMYVGNRVYDFPYLPGMLVAYLPFVALHLDIRFGSILYIVACATLVFLAARADRRREVAALTALFILCPFLQYRHELYLQPHWFTLVAAFFLMQRRHFAWAALVFGASMATYQFSWILFPFVVLNAFRRRGVLESLKMTGLAAAGALVIAGPFLASATRRIASNTVGQWGKMPHALAEPMNLSYWVTYLIPPDRLLRLQALLMIGIFLYCFARKRCTTLEDTLRWSLVALTLFVMLNVIVDGYFYLMLLVPMLIYTCVANGWWQEPEAPATLG